MKHHDFSWYFWRAFGINQRIYKPQEVLKIKRSPKEINADAKQFNNYLTKPQLLSKKKHHELMHLEVNNFYDFFLKYLGIENDELIIFCISQILNTAHNYKMIEKSNLHHSEFITLFAFQTAIITEYMKSQDIDVAIFDKALEKQEFYPFIELYKSSIKNNGTNEDFAQKLSYLSDALKTQLNVQEVDTSIDIFSPETLIKDLSEWTNKKSFPSFIKLLLLNYGLKQNLTVSAKQRKAYLFQMLIMRALLFINKQYKIKPDVKESFLQQYDTFCMKLKTLFQSSSDFEQIALFQSHYAIDMEYFFIQKIALLFNEKKYEDLIDLLKTRASFQITKNQEFYCSTFYELILLMAMLKTTNIVFYSHFIQRYPKQIIEKLQLICERTDDFQSCLEQFGSVCELYSIIE